MPTKKGEMVMARSKSDFLSAFGTAFEIWKRLTEAVLSFGGTDENLRRLLTDDELVKRAAAAIMLGVILPGKEMYIVRLSGNAKDQSTVFQCTVGPVDYSTIRAWLQENGFEQYGSSHMGWVKKGKSYVYYGDVSRSPLCNEVWAQVVALRDPDSVEIGCRPGDK